MSARGELVPQDPNDEPATELLKRIAEKIEKMQAAKKETPRKGAVAGSDLVADGVTGEGSVAPKSDKR